MGRLEEVDLSHSLSRQEEERELKRAWERLTELRLTLAGLIGEREIGPPVLVLFEGWDASGKGGAIKRLVAPLDPRHVRVVQFAAPTHDESAITSSGALARDPGRVQALRAGCCGADGDRGDRSRDGSRVKPRRALALRLRQRRASPGRQPS